MMKYTIRDLVSITILCAVSLGWLVDHVRQQRNTVDARWQRDAIVWILEQQGYRLHVTSEEVKIWGPRDKFTHWRVSRNGNYPKLSESGRP